MPDDILATCNTSHAIKRIFHEHSLCYSSCATRPVIFLSLKSYEKPGRGASELAQQNSVPITNVDKYGEV